MFGLLGAIWYKYDRILEGIYIVGYYFQGDVDIVGDCIPKIMIYYYIIFNKIYNNIM